MPNEFIVNTVLPKLNLSSDIINDIKIAISQGKEVTTHTNNVSVPGWSGAGYIVIDPKTGDGAYLISGGSNGAFLLMMGGLLMLMAISAIGMAGPVSLISATFFSSILTVSTLFIAAGLSLLLGYKKACLASITLAIGIINNILLKGWAKPFTFVYIGAIGPAWQICHCKDLMCSA